MKYQGVFIKGASGALGGLVASHNRYGDYFRGRTTPVNPNSARQQNMRNIFAALANAWSEDLTAVQRAAWTLYSNQVTVKDSGGNDIHITGFNHFIRSNSVAIAGGVARVDDGPTTFLLGEADATFVAVVDEATQKVTCTYDDTKDWCDEDGSLLQVSMSRPASPGIIWIPPVSRVAGYILGDSVTPPTTGTNVDCPFAVTETQKVIVTGRILRADGRLSGKFQHSSDVTA